jgi:inner membrane protein
MPSAIGHAVFAISLTPFRPYQGNLLSTLLLAMACATIPDLDVIGFELGIRYGDMLGHRGFSHSIVFAMMLGILIYSLFFREEKSNTIQFLSISWFFFCCTISHGLLDAMTDGGLGVGFFIPFSAERYFFSLRPIPVSSLNMSSFFTARGFNILQQELLFIGTISFFLIVAGYFWRKYFFVTD